MTEIYVSTDIEADGPIPGPNSMLSFASAAFLADGTPLGTFTANLELLEGASGDPKTMAWWQESLPGKPVFVAYPVAYDFMFVYWYLIRFAGESPFSHSALDIKTYAMATLGLPYRECSKRNMPKHWFPDSPHTHIALDDAIEQGQLFCSILAEQR